MTHHALMFSVRGVPYWRNPGAHRIATYLREQEWDVEVCDFAAYWPLHLLKEYAQSRVTKHTVFFGFSTFFNFWNPVMNEFTAWLKETWPDIPTVIGGQSVCATPAENMDYWVDSFGELAILDLARGFVGNTRVGIKFDMNYLGQRKVIKSISSYPAYPMESYRVKWQHRDFIQPFEWGTLEFSRGCKFSCSFCNFPILGVKGDYSRTQADFEAELRYNHDEFGVTNYYVADETFNDRVDKIIKFADVVDTLDFKPFFSGFMRGDLLIGKPESWEHIARLGFGGQYYGIESMNHASGKVVGKGMHPDRIQQGLIDVKKYFSERMFYRGTISLIIGLPFESAETVKQTERWLLEHWLDQGLIVFPLDVEDVFDEDANRGLTNTSDFGQNLLKYGIRKMERDPVKLEAKTGYYNWRVGGYAPATVMWEHDSMNLMEAQDISYHLQQKAVHDFKLDCWQLDLHSYNAQQALPLEHNAQWPKVECNVDINVARGFIKTYIDKKLNMNVIQGNQQ
jgi:hypothetical protein